MPMSRRNNISPALCYKGTGCTDGSCIFSDVYKRVFISMWFPAHPKELPPWQMVKVALLLSYRHLISNIESGYCLALQN